MSWRRPWVMDRGAIVVAGDRDKLDETEVRRHLSV
jgi:hypothetical protein